MYDHIWCLLTLCDFLPIIHKFQTPTLTISRAPPAMESIPTLRLLANIITESVNTMERVYTKAGMPLPSLDESFHRQDPAEALRQNSEISAAVKNLMAAAAQLTATVCDPVVMVVNSAFAFHISACLRAASELNVVEILREAGPRGVHAKEIAAPSRTSPDLMARILRLLATHHIFREVSPGVFANNRISSTLDKGKPSSILFENREERLTGTLGVSALVESAADNTFKASAFLTETLLHPEEQKLPYNRANRTDEPMFKVLQRPENRYNLKRFAVAMQGTAAADPPERILQGFDWGMLPSGGVLVDVGGGIGHASMAIALKYSTLQIINQDLGPAIELSKSHWKEHFPTHLNIRFQIHDFFTPQPVRNADVFLMRYIIHDWTNTQAVSILKHLREAAMATTKLVLIEKIVPVASGDELGQEIPGATRPRAAYPLLSNWGIATAELYMYDMTMHNMLGGVERTLEGFIDVLAESGWKLAQVHHCPPSQLSHLVAVPC
ncbi:O-methyltransferase [Mycena sp. CBHHK59/15]|nr:O-methyltransferase [Mycena sp. CBHHK59/15]